ncbi:MAG: CRISPR-associated helicase Cas3' [Candidatus Aenigmatarchaeota archaeon]
MKYLIEDKEIFNKLNKFSHPKKTLEEHINEIKECGKLLGNIYSLDWDVFEFLAEFHDIGKLDDEWDVSKKRSISHAAYSLLYTYKYYQYLAEKVKYFDILLYLIYRHHSLLTKSSCNFIYFKDIIKIFDLENHLPKDYFEKIRELVNKLDFKEKISIIDTFGIFKLCDIFSAKNIKDLYKIVNKFKIKKDTKEVVNKIIKKPDNDKLNKQIEISNHNDVILIAPTGWGKTTMSILFLKNRLFITLPTITAIRKFYKDLKEELKKQVGMYFYLYDAYDLKDLEVDRFLSYEFSRILLYPVMITTIDQILLTFLQAGKYYLRRFNFQRASFVIDEIHLLTPQMLYLFLYFYKKFKDIYNLRVLFMSATFPKAYINFIREFIPDIKIFNFADEYKHKRRVLYKYFEVDIEDWIKENIDFFNQDKKFLIITNTVTKAQKVYNLLKDNGYNSVLLLHSRFITKDRFKKEEEIDNYKILVATQVVEVSLNISRDFLLTELAPISSLMQRFGRVNRFSEKTDIINTYIFKPKEYEKIKENKTKYPYEFEDIEISEKIIKELENNLKNEYLLIEKFDQIYSYDNLKEKLNEEIISGYNIKKLIEIWERDFEYFYTAISESERNKEVIDELFNLRGNINILAIPEPKMIYDEEYRKELEYLLEEWKKDLSFEERKNLFAKLKNFAIPVPLWILRKSKDIRKFAFPVFYTDKLKYSRETGLYLVNEIDQIHIY